MNGLEAVAYEPSKGFRNIVRALRPGNRVRVVGSIRAQPKTLNIEKLQVLSLVEESRKLANPLCLRCQKRAKSMGTRAGFRCARCGQALERRFRIPGLGIEQVKLPRGVWIGRVGG